VKKDEEKEALQSLVSDIDSKKNLEGTVVVPEKGVYNMSDSDHLPLRLWYPGGSSGLASWRRRLLTLALGNNRRQDPPGALPPL